METTKLKLEITNHFKKRLEERNLNLKKIYNILRKKENVLEKYNDTGKELCLQRKGFTIIFEVRNYKIVLITCMNKYAYVKEDTVII